MMQSENAEVKSHTSVSAKWVLALGAAILFILIGPACALEPVWAHGGGDCGFFFCEPEEWLSNQNAIHFTSGYALHLTATGLNKSPWKNFLWLSVTGLGIETFQGAFLEHPLHGGFSYKNVIFNELGLLAGMAASEFLFDRDEETGFAEQWSSPVDRLPFTLTVLPMEQYLRTCCCRRPGGGISLSGTSLTSPDAAVAGLLKPGVFARYTSGVGVPPSDRTQ